MTRIKVADRLVTSRDPGRLRRPLLVGLGILLDFFRGSRSSSSGSSSGSSLLVPIFFQRLHGENEFLGLPGNYSKETPIFFPWDLWAFQEPYSLRELQRFNSPIMAVLKLPFMQE